MSSTSRRLSLKAPQVWARALRMLSPGSAGDEKRLSSPRDAPERGPISKHESMRLLELVAFLESNHRREEGLYRLEGNTDERAELRRLCVGDNNEAPLDLTDYNAHSIAHTINELLELEFAPLVPCQLSELLLERTAGRDEIGMMEEVLNVYKCLDSHTRVLLRELLCHWSNISTSIACRVSAKDLAKVVGIHMIRPTEDTAVLCSGPTLKRRRRLAKVLIENATALPQESVPIPLSVHDASATNTLNEVVVDLTAVFYVQVLWDNTQVSHDESSLEAIIGCFGEIVNLAINDSRNRAIVAYSTAEGARAASKADLEGVRVRYRKRSGTTQDSVRSTSPSEARRSPARLPDTADDSSRGFQKTHSEEAVTALQPTEQSDAVNESDDSGAFLHKLERPPSTLLHQRVTQATAPEDQMMLEDIDSALATPRQPQVDITQPVLSIRGEQQKKASVPLEIDTTLASESQSKPQQLKRRKSLFSPTGGNKLALISDLKTMLGKKTKPTAITNGQSSADGDSASSKKPPTSTTLTTANSVATQTRRVTVVMPMADQSTSTDELPKITDTLSSCGGCEVAKQIEGRLTDRVQSLEGCLRYTLQEVQELDAAIGASDRSGVNSAVSKVLSVLINRIQEKLSPETELSDAPPKDDASATATRDFVSFLETRSKTQITILEAEIRAGQELLRLHRTQHQSEVAELEHEVAGLRTVKIEMEKMCAELRGELRRCRNELTCHVANGASLQRERRDVEEKLILSETKAKTKEQEVLDLRAELAEMRSVAAQAQRRLEEQRGTIPVTKDGQRGVIPPRVGLNSTAVLSKAAAFLQQHQPQQLHEEKKLTPGMYTNSVELSAMQEDLRQQIQHQVEVTRRALSELAAFESDGSEGEDLDQLQQRLAAAQADMEQTMDDSRRQLDEMLFPIVVEQTLADRGHEASALVEKLIHNVLSSNQYSSSDAYDVEQHGTTANASALGVEVPVSEHWRYVPSGGHSQVYQQWLGRRSVKPVSVSKPATRSYAGNETLQAATQSMQRFQDALASVKTPTT